MDVVAADARSEMLVRLCSRSRKQFNPLSRFPFSHANFTALHPQATSWTSQVGKIPESSFQKLPHPYLSQLIMLTKIHTVVRTPPQQQSIPFQPPVTRQRPHTSPFFRNQNPFQEEYYPGTSPTSKTLTADTWRFCAFIAVKMALVAIPPIISMRYCRCPTSRTALALGSFYTGAYQLGINETANQWYYGKVDVLLLLLIFV
jgi:hypothetical protein